MILSNNHEGLDPATPLPTPTVLTLTPPRVIPLRNSVLIGFLYFVQGIILSLPGSIILTYPVLPNYNILSWFAACSLPFSFKFVSAPLIQKYTNASYGRRKTWIVLTCALTSLSIWALSYYTNQEFMLHMAVAFIFTVFLISIEDIATDALGIKELDSPQKLSFLQTIMQQLGLIFGSMVFIKLTSPSFGLAIGLSGAVMEPGQYFRMISLLILIPTILIHYKFKQTILDSELQVKSASLAEIFSHYKVFLSPRSRYFRQALFFVLFYQGTNVYSSGYQIELINLGFSKQSLNTIDNMIMIPLLVVTFLFSHVNTAPNKLRYIQYGLAARLLWQLLGFFTPSFSTFTLTGFVFVTSCLSYMHFIIDSHTVNRFPAQALSGMFVTALYSLRNLGANHTIHLKLISLVGFRSACWLGFVYSLIMVMMAPRMMAWIERGEVEAGADVKEAEVQEGQEWEAFKSK